MPNDREGRNIRVCVGIPCYHSVSPETLDDYMRFMFHVGRRLPHLDLALAIKSKSEQFRARNGIVTAALQTGCDYLLMLDDDHVIDWEHSRPWWDEVESRYDFIAKMVAHLEADPKLAIVGGLYYHRGGECLPVILKEGKDGGLYYIRDDELQNGLQDVAVAGGGCIMIDMKLFEEIPAPWFQIENKYGTDIQICNLAREHGYKVACDTSIVVGHVLNKREVVTPKNRLRICLESSSDVTTARQQFEPEWVSHSALQLYKSDAMQYGGWEDWSQLEALGLDYQKHRRKILEYENPCDYYRDAGPAQLARQVMFHFTPNQIKCYDPLVQLIDVGKDGYGLDYGCGSAPVTFDYVLRGQKMDFVDIPGSYAYEFTKWRAKHRGVEDRCGWEMCGPYDYVFMLDSIEHLHNWRDVLTDILARLRNGGAFITNYFGNEDRDNPEHVSMDHQAVKQFLTENSVYPVNMTVWVKQEWGMP